MKQNVSLSPDCGTTANLTGLVVADALMFNQTVGVWNISSVTDLRGMFSFAESFNQPLNDWVSGAVRCLAVVAL